MKHRHRNGSSRTRAGNGAKHGLGLAAAALCCAPLAGGAQESQQPGIEEVVVTAQRREESLRDVPISLSAYGEEQMDVQGLRAIDDIAKLAPGISFGRSSFGNDLGSQISIRGIASGAGTATTGIYIDDTPIQVRSTIASGNFSTNAYPRLFDLERVEVLRGPQGTLFGAGSEGGTVRFITPAPSLTRSEVYARSEIGFTEGGDPSYEAGLAGGTPLLEDRIGMRASVSYRHDGGYVDRVDYASGRVLDDGANRMDSVVARLAFAFAPTDTLVITPSIIYQSIDANDASVVWLPSDDPAFPQPLSDLDAGRYESGQRVRQFQNQDLALSALKIDWDLGGVALVSNTSFYDRNDESVTDFTNFETPLWTSIFTGTSVTIPANPSWIAPGADTQDNEFFTQEIRLQSQDPESRLSWVVGGFYSDQDTVTNRAVQNTWLPEILSATSKAVPQIPDCEPADCYMTFFRAPAAEGIYIFRGLTTTNDKQLAAFGQVDFKITDNLTATAGVRYARMEFDFTNVTDGAVPGPPSPQIDTGTQKENATTPKFGLSYKTNDGNLFYASAAKGFRPGGANAGLRNPACIPDLAELGLTEVPLTYDSDHVWSYELGTKLAFAGGRVQVNSSVFRVDWKDIITNQSLDCILSFTTNRGEARSQGADIDVQLMATDNLLLSASLGYTDAEYTKTLHPLDPDTGLPVASITLVEDGDAISSGLSRQGTPGWTGHAAAQYSFNAFQDRPSYVRLDYSYTGEPAKGPLFNPTNPGYDARSLFRDPATHLVNARFGVNFGNLDLSLFVNNLLNDDAVISEDRVHVSSSLRTGLVFRPRTFGLTALYRY